MSHVFISYSRQDIDFARYVRALLENHGFAVWMDEKRLSAGMDWWDEIEANIDSCVAFVVIMSPDSRESVFVRNEILRALDQKRALFPILYRGKHFGMLAHVHYEEMLAGLNASFSSDFLNRLRDIAGINDKRKIRFEVIHHAIESVQSDVVLLKYAQGLYGADKVIYHKLRDMHADLSCLPLDEIGAHCVIPTNGGVASDTAVFVSTNSPWKFSYSSARDLASRGLTAIGAELPNARHLTMTVHGVNNRIFADEAEIFLAQLAGLIDVLQVWQGPRALEKITIVELSEDRTRRIKDTLQGFFEGVPYAEPSPDDTWGYDLTFTRKTQVSKPSAGDDHTIKPYAVAIFPNHDEMDDIFYYGIQRPVHAMGLLCERLSPIMEDEATENLDAVLERMRTASAIICDVTDINPLLYLQLGYARGRDIPTLLIIRDMKQLPFNEIFQYDKIWQLEEHLGQWLQSLE